MAKGTLENNKKHSNLYWSLPLSIIVIFLLVGFYTAYQLFSTHNAAEESLQPLALLGDFIGGFFNPLFGFVTVILLIVSLRVQIHELRVANNELSLSRLETAKSSEAVVKQFEHIERQKKVSELESLLKSYQEVYKDNLNKEWPIVDKLLDENGSPYVKDFSTFDENTSYWELIVGWNTLNTEYRDKRVDCLKSYRDIEGYALLINLSKHSAELLQKQAEVIAELIQLGMSWKYCDLKVSQLYVFLNDCVRVKLLYQANVKACYEIIQEATTERQKSEPNFIGFKNKLRDF